MELVQFDCGCIGFKPDADGQAWILMDCTSEDRDYWFFQRSMVDKTYAPLDSEKLKKIIHELNTLIAAGYRLQTVQTLLSIKP